MTARKLLIVALLLVTALSAGGCAELSSVLRGGGAADAESPAEKLDRARTLIRDGRGESAKKVLRSLVVAKAVPGITDEALFHLGLLILEEEDEANGYPESRQYLERLVHDYPTSLWARQAAPLVDILVSHWLSEVSLGKIKRQMKNLKDSNLSLTRENKELRLNIEKLKNLDVELERKSRH